MSQLEPSTPVQVWKPELYKIQLEAPTPKPIHRNAGTSPPPTSAEQPPFYGTEYHGDLDHKRAEELLSSPEASEGSYLLRRSPNTSSHYTLSLRFNKRIKHYKIYYTQGEGHYLREQGKRYDSIYDLVADGLVIFYMQQHAAPIIEEIQQQRPHCYQHSPYMTLNRRKLYAISEELRKSIVTKESRACRCLSTDTSSPHKNGECTDTGGGDGQQQDDVLAQLARQEAQLKETLLKEADTDGPPLTNGQKAGGDPELDTLAFPVVYEKSHSFKVHNFKGLNWCEFCANFLWGFTAQGVKCEACGFVAHSKCSELVPPKCVPDLKRIRGVFGTDLTTMVQLHQCQIPFVVRRCVEEVEARGILQEGIYRVSGFADEIDALKLALDRDGEKTDMSEAAYGSINVIAGTLKLYLRLLPLPLITFQAYPSFMQAAAITSSAEQLKSMSEAAKKLPPAHYDCLKFMLEHLKRVASHYAANKMNEHNLATVFAPTLIATPQHITNLTEEIFMLSTLITNCETIFQ